MYWLYILPFIFTFFLFVPNDAHAVSFAKIPSIFEVVPVLGLFLAFYYLCKVYLKSPFSLKPIFFAVLALINFLMLIWMGALLPTALPEFIVLIFSVLVTNFPAWLMFWFLFKGSFKMFLLDLTLAGFVWSLIACILVASGSVWYFIDTKFYYFLFSVLATYFFIVKNNGKEDGSTLIRKLVHIHFVIVLCFFLLPLGMDTYYSEQVRRAELSQAEEIKLFNDRVQFK